ncbi:MAG: hypothetical protein ABI034_12930 [Nakamurella sp.]
MDIARAGQVPGAIRAVLASVQSVCVSDMRGVQADDSLATEVQRCSVRAAVS